MATDLSICNTALELVGANSINSFQDETRESRLCNQVYVTTRDTLLQQKRWSFTLEIRQLSRLVAAPAEEYNYQFQLPADIIGIAKIFSMSLVQDTTMYQLYEDEAKKALLRAKSVDGQLGPNLKVDVRTFDLTAVR